MPKLIKDKQITDNPWVLIEKDAASEAVLAMQDSHLLLPLSVFKECASTLRETGKQVAAWIDSDETPDSIADDLDKLDMIAINFPVFTDGRGYTSATSLRQRYGYTGEIRAIGDVLVDQLFAMKRCGIDAWEVSDDTDMDAALAAFDIFSTSYMSTVEVSEPLFKRRSV